jgi:hypothetical protein
MRMIVLAACLCVLVGGCGKSAERTAPDKSVLRSPQEKVSDVEGAFFGIPIRTFFGIPRTGRKVAFVIGRSGSMTDSIAYVQYELKRTIKTLAPKDRFYMVFYSSGPVVELPAREMVFATEANKQQAYKFIDAVVPRGSEDPAEALRLALDQKPDVLYLLSDGEASDFKQPVLDLIDQHNADRKTVINTIEFVYGSVEVRFQEIARKYGGAYKFIGEDDLLKNDEP